MWFARFRHRPQPDRPGDLPAETRSWRESDIGDEVSAILEGRAAAYFLSRGRPIPPWAVLNRVAHAEWSELVHLVEGNQPDRPGSAGAPRVAWATTERFVAGHLLARAANPGRLREIQLEVLVPVEMRLIDRSKVDRLTADEVLEAGDEALDTPLSGH
jgi:hypothetical protein